MAGWLTQQQKLKLMPKLLRIVDKAGELVPLRPNRCQRYVVENSSDKTQILKPRQTGVSTAYAGEYFLDCIVPNPETGMSNITAVIFSYDDEATRRLLGKIDTFYESLPNPKPYMGRDTTYLKTFPELGSRLYIGTAQARVAGLGDTVNRAHLTEYAYWPEANARKIREGLEESVPFGDRITIENTANGEGGEFYDMWNNPSSPYKKLFLPWFWHEEYTLERDNPRLGEIQYFVDNPRDCGELEYTADEAMLVSAHGLTEDQVRWRRMKVAGTAEKFAQWYPEDEVGCFLASGLSFFGMEALKHMGTLCSKAPIAYPDEGLNIWELPMYGEKYVIGVDAADPDPKNPEAKGDWCGAVVLSSRMRHVATLRGRWDPLEFANKVAKLAVKYNGAYIVPERNNTGSAVILALQSVEKYPYIYMTGGRGGWINTSVTKRQLVAMMKDVVDSLAFYTRDSNLVTEFRTFRKIGDKYKAKDGAHDDLVISAGLALWGLGDVHPATSVPRNTGAESYGWAKAGI